MCTCQSLTEWPVWDATVTSVQQELVVAHELSDGKLSELRRQTEDTVATQQAAFDRKVSDG